MGTAVVVGAGIGGLAAAVGLRRRGWDVVVLERAGRFEPVGAGLTLMGNGLAALAALGLGDAVRATVRPYGGVTLRSRRGTVLARAAVPAGSPSCGVHRATLHRLLLEALPDDVVVPGAEVTAVTGGDRPTVTHRSPDGALRTLDAELVVGADGVRSGVRSALWPDVAAPAGLGCTAWRGVTRDAVPLHPVPGRDAEVSWGPGTEVGLVPLEDGRVYWYVSVTDDRVRAGHQDDAHHGAHDGAHDAARALVDGWYPAVRDAVAATAPDAVLRTPLVHLDPGPSTYVRGAVALLGDAAHAMPPFVGQGANQALEDAAVLAALAGPGDDVAGALAEYDRRRRPRAQRVARAAVRAGRAGQLVRSPVVAAARDVTLLATPGALLARALGAPARWRAPVVPAGR